MKKLYLIVLLLSVTAIGFSQCVVDVNNTQFGISPPDSVFPNILKGHQLDNSYVAQFYLPTSITVQSIPITIYWIKMDTITGFPAGISYAKNPVSDTVYGGGRNCIQLSGLTNAFSGDYPLTFDGFIRVNVLLLGGDTTMSISQLNQLAQLGGPTAPHFGYKVKVVDPNGINDVNSMLTAAMQVIPNPNHGQFDIRFNYHGMIEGELRIVDISGRIVYSKNLDTDGFYSTSVDLSAFAKGMYAVQLKTADGVATKNISVE
jgi:hypothetical protein